MGKILLYRKSNMMLMARKFKIYVDDEYVDGISDGEEKWIELPVDAQALTVKIMNYESKPLDLNDLGPEMHVIKQNIISTLVTIIMVVLAAIFFGFKFGAGEEQPIILLLALPFLAASIYYSTFGRRSVILVEKAPIPDRAT